MNATSEVPPEAPQTASAAPEALFAPEAVKAPFEVAPEVTVPEDSAVIPEAISAATEASVVVTETLPAIDCNVEAAVL